MKYSQGTFCLTQSSSIFLYGDNFIARRLLKNLCVTGYSIKAIIDKKYTTQQIESSGLELISLELIDEIPDNAIVIIALSNGLMHEKVKSDLCKKGFHNILYLPMLQNRPLMEQDIIRRAYYDVTKNMLSPSVVIPQTFDKNNNAEIIQIFKNEKETAFLCDVDLLRTATKKIVNGNVLPGRENLLERVIKYLEVPLKDNKPYVDLFDYLAENDNYPSEYLYIQRETDEQRNILLEDRKKLYNVYEQNYEYNFSFFLYSPASAEWNKKGYFNVIDGLHRCIYLMHKGKKKVPVVVSNEDFSKFINYKG